MICQGFVISSTNKTFSLTDEKNTKIKDYTKIYYPVIVTIAKLINNIVASFLQFYLDHYAIDAKKSKDY